MILLLQWGAIRDRLVGIGCSHSHEFSCMARCMAATPLNFYISPSAFGQYTGPWYRLNVARETGWTLPSSLRIPFWRSGKWIQRSMLMRLNRWVSRGDQVSFRIDTNLNPIFSRGTSSSEGITIRVQSPDGGTYSALIDSSGTPHPIENLAVSTPSYETGPIWDTGNSRYFTGTYTIWAECNVNSMKDNYGLAGKTISQQTSLLDQDQNPLISLNVPQQVRRPRLPLHPQHKNLLHHPRP